MNHHPNRITLPGFAEFSNLATTLRPFLCYAFYMTVHVPVLVDPILELLDIQPNDIVFDGTLGGGGHSREFLKRLGPDGRLIGFDRDPEAVESTRKTFDDPRVVLVDANYADAPELLPQLEFPKIDKILLDLGYSSDQLEDHDRGFSFNSDGPLDLRFNALAGEPASRLVNRLGEKHLADLIYEFSQEKLSRRIARKICKVRHAEKIETAAQLARIVRSCVPRTRGQKIDPATRTFQALRIAVNEELKWLKVAMNRLPEMLNEGGRFAAISFHSMEDRIVKQAFNANDSLEVLTKKPLIADEAENEKNPRASSAKLRVALKKDPNG